MIVITGSSGFVGKNLTNYFDEYNLTYKSISLREDRIDIPKETETIIHLAGKAHDLKNVEDESAYFKVNTELTQKLYDKFIESNAKTFIFISSVKAAADSTKDALEESCIPNPQTPYGKSKLKAEKYLLENSVKNKRVLILRPCMIHGPNNKGNLNLLYQLVKKNIPYPLGSFENQRSFLSVDNLNFVILELIRNETIKSGIFHLADDIPLSTNQVVGMMYDVIGKKQRIWHIPRSLIRQFAIIGDLLHLPINSEKLKKLTESYVVNNTKIKQAIRKEFPLSSEEGLLKTIKSLL